MGAFTSPAVLRHAPQCWFPLAHAEAIAEHPGLSLVAALDSDTTASARAAEAYGIPQTFTDLDTMLEAVKPDLLCVATRTIGRAAIIQQAVASGVRALHVEKPLCNSMAELAALEAVLARPDVHLTYGAIRRHMTPYQAAINHVASGAMGKLLEIQVHMGQGPLCWTHPHSLDLLLFAAGERQSIAIAATLDTVERGTREREVLNDPSILSATLHFSVGVTGRITRVPGADLLLACETGSLLVEADGHRIAIQKHGDDSGYLAWGPWADAPARQQGGTLSALKQLTACLDGDAAALAANQVVKRDTLAGQRLLFAILQSNAAGGLPMRPQDVFPDWDIKAITHGRHA